MRLAFSGRPWAVRQVTVGAGVQVGLLSVGDNIWHRGMRFGMPVGHGEEVSDLSQRVRLRAVGNMLRSIAGRLWVERAEDRR